jgi:hypothetical protein
LKDEGDTTFVFFSISQWELLKMYNESLITPKDDDEVRRLIKYGKPPALPGDSQRFGL